MWQIDTIKKYKNTINCFVETGTWQGDGIQVALDLGFDIVYSCDIDLPNIEKANIRFLNKNVNLTHSSSAQFLKKIIPKLNDPSLIWLDAHVMADHTGVVFSNHQLELVKNLNVGVCPLMEELEIIFKYAKIPHTILIDDYHCFGNWEFDNLSVEDVKKYILEKNSHYNFSVEQNILCCFI